MTVNEINSFIETMEEINDIWTKEDVERVYGESTLEEALNDRKSSIGVLGNIMRTVLNQ